MVSSYGIQALPIAKALELYDILGKYLPEFSEDAHILDFVGTIVDNIANEESTAYADAIMLMTNHTLEELQEFPTDFLLKLFSTGLLMNDVMNLRRFCEDIGYG